MTDQFGVPYAAVYFRGAQSYVDCPACGATFALVVPKDEESHSTQEYAKHYVGAHVGVELSVPGGTLWLVDPSYLGTDIPDPGPEPREHIFAGKGGTGLLVRTPELVRVFHDRRQTEDREPKIANLTIQWGTVHNWHPGGDEVAVDSGSLVAITPEAARQWTEGQDPFEEGTDRYQAFRISSEDNTSCAGAGLFQATGGEVFATSSGCGDGVYPWDIGLDEAGTVVGVRVLFFDPDEDSE